MVDTPKILVVDDEQRMRESLRHLLRHKGYDVRTSINGEQALEVLDKKAFDMVITNLFMGRTNGLAVLKRVKQDAPETMVIIHTGYRDTGTVIDALRLAADDYILKPCDPEQFFFRVQRCLEKMALQRKIKVYENFVTICSVCKKVRNDAGRAPGTGRWLPIEDYLHRREKLKVSSTYCPACYQKTKDELEKM